MAFQPKPRVVDALVLASTAVVLGSGLASLLAGRPSQWWVVATHASAAFVLIGALAWKLRRVAPRLRPSRWEGRTVAAALTLGLALAALGMGLAWVLGASLAGPWTLLTVHGVIGVLLLAPLLWHLRHRFRLPRRTDVEGRRTALQTMALVGGGVLAWRLQEVVLGALKLATADRRFSGSREAGLAAGNTFPVTSWVADDPAPVDPGSWSLSVVGAVDRPLVLGLAALDGRDDRRATLDCTGGWYTVQDWRGVRVGRLLEAAGASADARWVRFESVTGYRWNLPIEEAREALLATHVGGERLTHGHGAPLRLVAHDRRGFQWVKWVERIEVRTAPDYGQWLAIFTSGFGEG